jgi:hypothetical protein
MKKIILFLLIWLAVMSLMILKEGPVSRAKADYSCLPKGLSCVLDGTPCCAPYKCGGKFPNTTCQ